MLVPIIGPGAYVNGGCTEPYMPPSWRFGMSYLSYLAQALVAVVFRWAGVAKLQDVSGFARYLRELHLRPGSPRADVRLGTGLAGHRGRGRDRRVLAPPNAPDGLAHLLAGELGATP